MYSFGPQGSTVDRFGKITVGDVQIGILGVANLRCGAKSGVPPLDSRVMLDYKDVNFEQINDNLK